MKHPDSRVLKFVALSLLLAAGAWAQQPGIITTVVGNGTSGYTNGPVSSATLSEPYDVLFDSSGNMYIADQNSIRELDTSGNVSFYAGNGVYGYSPVSGVAATSQSFFRMFGVSLDTSGNVIFADQNGDVSTVNRTTGILNFVAGDLANANAYYGDNGPALSAGLHDPWDAIEDSAGNLYIADHGNNVIRRVDRITGIITTYAGNNATGGAFSGDNGPATGASLYAPLYLVFDGSGNLYFSDSGNNRVRRIDHTTGIITTVAGNGTATYSGDGGPAIGASLSNPAGLAFDTSGNLYIADLLHDVIREVNTSGIISTVAGDNANGGTYSGDGGQATLASLNFPYGIAVYNSRLYIADTLNFRIRRVELVPPATTNLGSEAVNQTTTASTVGFNSMTGTAASYTMAYGTEFTLNSSTCSGGVNYGACSVTFTPKYPGPRWDALLAKDSNGNLIGTEYVYGIGQGALGVVTPGLISSIDLNSLGSVRATGAAFDPAGNLYIVDSPNDRVIKVNASGNASVVTITGETLNTPSGIAADGAGNLDIVDTGNNRIVQVSPSGAATAVTPSVGLLRPTGIALATNGTLYVADSGNSRIVEIPLSGTSSVLSLNTTLMTPVGVAFDTAGDLYIADRGLHSIVTLPSGGTSSIYVALSDPAGISTDAAGNVYVADNVLNQVFRISSSSPSTLIAGNGSPGDAGDGGVATLAELNTPTGVAVAPDGTVYITDNQTLRKISPGAMAFGSVKIGATATENASVTNIGNQPFAFPAAFGFGQNRSEFSLVSTGSGDCSALLSSSLAAAASCNVEVQFAPTVASAYPDTLTLATGLQISLSGTGTSIAISGPLAPNSTALSVPSLFVDGSGSAQTITLTNTGVNAMNIASFALSGPNQADFNVTTTCGTTLAAAAACTISITFTPSVAGNESATLAITYADAVSGVSYTQNVSLSGPGLSGLPTGTVEILNRNSGQALDVLLQSTADGAALQQYPYLGLANQQWQFVLVEPGYYKIVNVNSGLVLDVTAESTEDGARIQQWTYLGTDNQKWSVTQLSDGSFQIMNKLSGKLLDVTALSLTAGALIQQWDSTGAKNQKWSIIAAQQYFTVTNKLSGKVLDVTGLSREDGARLQQWDNLDGANQEWQFVPLGNGYYQILNRNSGLVLDATDPTGAVPDGTPVQQWDYLGGENQQWQIIPLGNGYFEIANKANGKVLDVTGLSTSDGAAIQVWDYLDGENQQWSITEVR